MPGALQQTSSFRHDPSLFTGSALWDLGLLGFIDLLERCPQSMFRNRCAHVDNVSNFRMKFLFDRNLYRPASPARFFILVSELHVTSGVNTEPIVDRG